MQTISLGQITKIKTGKLDANAKVEGGKYPFFTCSKEISWIENPSYDCECVLIAGTGDLNVKYYKGKFDAYQRTYIIESNGIKDLDIKYLYYFMDQYMETLRGQTIGGVIQYIKMNNLTDIEIPLPPLATQKAIAAKLDKMQSLIDLKKLAIVKTDELAKSIFLDMFGDPMTNEKGWEIKTMKDICNKITDGTHDTPTRLKEGVMFITGKNIRPFEFDLSDLDYVLPEVHETIYQRCNPEFEDVLYTNIGVNMGTAVLNTFKFPFSMKNVALFKINKNVLRGYYLTYLLNLEQFKIRLLGNNGKGGAQGFLSLDILRKLNIPLPPLSMQQKFADIITQIEAQKSEHKLALAKLEELYQAEMQKSFSL